MTDFLLVGIPRLLFEPIAVGAVLGGISACIQYRNKKSVVYWIVIAAIVVMFAWRLALYSLMVSSRYASILFYPATILTAWFCFWLDKSFQRTICDCSANKQSLYHKKHSYVLIFLLAGLSIASLVKIVNHSHNPYGQSIVKICDVLKKDIDGKDFILYSESEPDRIAYYSGIDWSSVRDIGKDNIDDEPLSDLLKKRICLYENYFENIYFIFSLKQRDQEPTLAFLGVDSKIGEWDCIGREFTSGKKNKQIVLYRFTPSHPHIEEWSGSIPEISSENLIQNGDFEKELTGERKQSKIKKYKELEIFDYTDPNRIIPDSWFFELGNMKDNPPDMRLSDSDAIAGHYSLSVDSSNTKFSSAFCTADIKKQNDNCRYQFFCRNDGLQGSTFSVHIRSWLKEENRGVTLESFSFFMKPGPIYRIHGIVSPNQLPSNADSFYILICADGKYTVDQFSVTPENTHR